MAATTRTYYCGPDGFVRRLDNLTGAWSTVSVPNTNINLNDIKTDPTNPDKVFTVGNFNTIYVSSNAGVTWVQPTGLYLSYPNTQWYEVWPVDSQDIVVCGDEGLVIYSNDGGLTFGPVPALPTPSGGLESGKAARAIHAFGVSGSGIGVVGFEDLVFKTVNSATTWIPCNSGLPLVGSPSTGPVIINGVHIDVTGLIIVVHSNTNIWRSTDGGITFIPVYTYLHTITVGNPPVNVSIRHGRHLTWLNDNSLWGTGDYNEMVQSIDGGASWTLLRTSFPTFTACLAAHFYSQTDGFYSLSTRLLSTADSGLTGTPSDVIPVTEHWISAVWTGLPGPCYRLIICGGRPFPIIVNDDLAQYVGFVVEIGEECYTVQLSETCEGAITMFPGGVPALPTFPSCVQCDPPDCFELIDCTNQTPVIITSSDLSDYEGQVIKICNFKSNLNTPLTYESGSCPIIPGVFSGTVSQVTGPTSGYYYNFSAAPGNLYTNPTAIPLVQGNAICLVVGLPPSIQAVQPAIVYTIQFFIGTTPITNPIFINETLTILQVQFIINQEVIFPLTYITVLPNFSNTFEVDVFINTPITETVLTMTISPDLNSQLSFTAPITGECICYTVTNIGPCIFERDPPPPLPDIISGVFPDCECCLGPPPPEPEPPYEPTIPEIDKGTYRICESECDIENNKLFASAMYDKFKTDAYGMENCCPRNFDKIWIRKELSDLSKIKC